MDFKTDQHAEKDEGLRPAAQVLSAEMDPLERNREKKDENTASDKEKNPDQPAPSHPWRKWLLIGGGVLVAIVAAVFLTPWLVTVVNTVSTDDAYVNGHVTFVAPRVAGQVREVRVDDNYRVKKGDILVRLDREPYRVQADLKRSAWRTAKADLAAAEAQVRSLEALARSHRWDLELAMQQVAKQIAQLRSAVATYQSRLASMKLADANRKRGEELALTTGAITQEDLDQRRQAAKSATAAAEEALQQVYAARVNLGLPARPSGDDLGAVPPNLEQTYPGVRSALAKLLQTMAQIGRPLANAKTTPQQILDQFEQNEKGGKFDQLLDDLVAKAPIVQQAAAKHEQARHDLEQAELNLRYCDIVSEIDGVVTRRNVNPGNNVDPQQMLMAVRSVNEVWIDANFKESQLSYLRIGQRVRCRVDMYGRRREFEGRITGFSMGTGAALSLLPPQNATGNFVKIVQRLPVRIELTDYRPEELPLLVGLSVVPYVYYKEPVEGPHAGEYLQPIRSMPQGPTISTEGGRP